MVRSEDTPKAKRVKRGNWAPGVGSYVFDLPTVFDRSPVLFFPPNFGHVELRGECLADNLSGADLMFRRHIM